MIMMNMQKNQSFTHVTSKNNERTEGTLHGGLTGDYAYIYLTKVFPTVAG